MYHLEFMKQEFKLNIRYKYSEGDIERYYQFVAGISREKLGENIGYENNMVVRKIGCRMDINEGFVSDPEIQNEDNSKGESGR